MAVTGVDHVFYAMPAGGLAEARRFWGEGLGLTEIKRPEVLHHFEGTWFSCGTTLQVHLGVDPDFKAARRAHTALRVSDLEMCAQRLRAAGYAVTQADERIEGCERFFTADPFGSRVELLLHPSRPAGPGPAPRSVSAPAVAVAATVTTSSPGTSLPPILLLGDPRLRQRSAEVTEFQTDAWRAACDALARTLAAFRAKHGFGRAVSAPQIGHMQRLIAVNLGKGVFFVVNPVYTHKSAATFTMFDDCMSFPDLLVKVRRHTTVSIAYCDHEGRAQRMDDVDQATSELLQHEMDHLDGVLAVDLADNPGQSLVIKAEIERNRAEFRKQVDYLIGDAAPAL